jgi:excisionase family DNA binding protein
MVGRRVAQAAGLLSVSKRTVARLLDAGKIKAAKLGSRVLVDVPSLKAFLAAQPSNTESLPRGSADERGRAGHQAPAQSAVDSRA